MTPERCKRNIDRLENIIEEFERVDHLEDCSVHRPEVRMGCSCEWSSTLGHLRYLLDHFHSLEGRIKA